MESAPPAPDLRAAATNLGAGFLLLFLAFFGGSGGYVDLQEYLDDAQRLWLKGDLRVTEDPPTYNRYAPGLPLVSGPFVWAGRLLSAASGGAVGERGFIALTVPVLGALAAVLLFFVSIALGCRARTACWAATVLALASPLLAHTHFYYAEVLVLAASLLTVLGLLRAQGGGRDAAYLAAGIGIGLMPLAHNSAAPGAAALWAGAVATLWWNGAEGDRGRRGLRTLLLTAAPALVAVALLGINYARHGSPFVTGYHVRFAGSSHTFLQAAYIPRNLAVMARWMAGTPWLAPALALALAAAWCNRGLRLPIGLALAAQTAFWLCYRDLHITTTRYLLPLTGLFALGLPRLGEWLEERYPGRGPAVALALFLAAAASGFFWDDWFRPFFYSTLTGEWRCCTWYMSPQPDPTRLGSAVGPVQGIVLAALLASGGALLARAWRAASRWDRSRTAPGTP